ncbi:MAG: hypothetical protein JNJ73_12860 [Hyphomonadaceae bacterium]|nr:hypothetical protein [Hyphomonadaceae bacterium]
MAAVAASRVRSPRGALAALALLLGVLGAIGALAFGQGAETIIHAALGVTFVLFASCVFDFRLPVWINLLACAAAGGLAAIFLLQGLHDLAPSEPLRRVAFDVLGQRVEKYLGWAFLAWCVCMLAIDSVGGWAKALGAVVLVTILGVEIYSETMVSLGREAPGALKLLYLPLFVWLLLESIGRRGER